MDKTFGQSFKDALPLSVSYMSIGLAYGMIAAAAGFSIWQVAATSLFLYAGAAQFLLVNLLSQQAMWFTVAVLVFLVNFRFVLMSLSMAHYFQKQPWWSALLMGPLVTDESYGLFTMAQNRGEHLSIGWMHGVNVWSYIAWFIASVFGAAFGNLVPNPQQYGLDFALVGMFAGLWILTVQGFWQTMSTKRRQIFGLIILSALVYVAVMLLWSDTAAILCATFVGGVVGMLLEKEPAHG
jgi:4-azaleucine resistance transporter AzlC